MSVDRLARRLVERRPGHRVISLYLDLDPEEFATPPARESQVHSLIDGAARDVESDEALGHEDLVALRQDLERIRRYLLSDEPPYQGARALAVFACARDDLFEVIQIPRPVEGRVVIERTPYVEPLLGRARSRRWCAALVSRRDARVLIGSPDDLGERARQRDEVHGQHSQGGWSQSNYERSVEDEVDAHLRHLADSLHRLWQREPFDRLALGGPQEVVARLEGMLHNDLRQRLADGRVEVDLSSATDDDVGRALSVLVDEDDRRRERDALDRLAAGLGSGRRAAGGPEATLEALNERRVELLLLERGLRRAGGRCPRDGLLTAQAHGACPADGNEVDPVEDLGEAAIEAALMQDAEVIIVERYPDLGPHQGFAALLRF